MRAYQRVNVRYIEHQCFVTEGGVVVTHICGGELFNGAVRGFNVRVGFPTKQADTTCVCVCVCVCVWWGGEDVRCVCDW
jgi:hypothetical protein